MDQPGQMVGSSGPGHRRRTVRLIAAAASAGVAIVYFLIGLGLVEVVDRTAAGSPDLLVFGVSAGLAFGVGALLLLGFDNRLLWALGAILQVGVIVMYVAVAPNRTPPFELWGIVIKVLQAVILVALLYLLIRAPEPRPTTQRLRQGGV
jgi:peptidoglycan/LPS O-acetylase OafA/YrhL